MSSRKRLWDRTFSWLLPLDVRHWIRPKTDNGRDPERSKDGQIRIQVTITVGPDQHPTPSSSNRSARPRSAPTLVPGSVTAERIRAQYRLKHLQPVERTDRRPRPMKIVKTNLSLSAAIDVMRLHNSVHHDGKEIAFITTPAHDRTGQVMTYRVLCTACGPQEDSKGAKRPMTEQQQEHSWIRLDDGQSAQFKILSADPQIHTLHWVQGQAQDHLDQNCNWCQAGIRKSVRYTVPIESQDGSDKWEMASLTWKDLQAVQAQVGTLEGLTIALSRRGTGRQTRYTIIPLGNIPLPEPAEPTPKSLYRTGPITPASPVSARTPEEEYNAVQNDPMGAKEYIKNLCAALETDPKQEVTDQQQAAKEANHPLSPPHIMAALIQNLEHRVANLGPATGDDIDAAFADWMDAETD